MFLVPEDIFELVLVEGDEEHDGDAQRHAKQVEEQAYPLPAMLLSSGKLHLAQMDFCTEGNHLEIGWACPEESSGIISTRAT